jgi:hypothetical protein
MLCKIGGNLILWPADISKGDKGGALGVDLPSKLKGTSCPAAILASIALYKGEDKGGALAIGS